MTRDEIMALSGVSLRRAVAEKVMGYWVYHYTKGPRGYYMLLDDEDHPLGLERRTEEEAWADCPPFEDDPAAALTIIPVMGERGWDCAIYYEAATKRSSVYFLCDSDENAGATATANLLAEAISKAALLALLEEADAT